MVMAASDCFNQLFFGGALMHAVIGIDVSKATSQVAVAVDGKVVRILRSPMMSLGSIS